MVADPAVLPVHATTTRAAVHVVAADHPSLDRDIEAFIDRLQCEQRRFGPSARSNPKPSRSLCAGLRHRGGFRLAAVDACQTDDLPASTAPAT